MIHRCLLEMFCPFCLSDVRGVSSSDKMWLIINYSGMQRRFGLWLLENGVLNWNHLPRGVSSTLKMILFNCYFTGFLAFCITLYADYTTASKCQNLQANQTDFEVDFWSFFPYSVNENKTTTKQKGKITLKCYPISYF